MKSVLLIGLGRFGRHMAAKLQELHHEVLAVDKNEERVNEALDLVTHAQIDQHRECQNDSNHAHYDHVVYILPSFSVRFDESGALCRVPSFPAPPNMSSN